MVIEMLLNNDIQFFFVQIILNFQKEINVIMYIIENFKNIKNIIIIKKNSNHFIWTKSQYDMNFQSLCFCNV